MATEAVLSRGLLSGVVSQSDRTLYPVPQESMYTTLTYTMLTWASQQVTENSGSYANMGAQSDLT